MKNKKLLALVCCLALLVGAVGATLAWLTAQTQEVTNTFTAGDVNITLTETDAVDLTPNDTNNDLDKEYKMVPGDVEAKDPTVHVIANSEACYLYVKVAKTINFDYYMAYEMADGWNQLKDDSNNDVAGVFYRVVDEDTAKTGADYIVLKDNEVTVKDTITKEDLNGVGTDYPTISFIAYAAQFANMDNAYDAWTKANFN